MAISSITASGSAPAVNQRTVQWEYMTLSCSHSYGSTTYELNGEKETRLKNVALHAALSLLGQQGWELVSTAGADGRLYVFKRPASG
ncbi:MAG: hypothetical protein BroJett033_9040 [Chloroflexota bacterium]|nr:MAG: hypothetical protein BroJett033_9040 [Chloroflexota bacterium]